MSGHNLRREDASRDATRSRSRSRSREHDAMLLLPSPRRQLRSATRAAAAIDAAYGNYPRSISRLHDDEVVSVVSFLALPDLATLVCCNRRLRHVACRERSRGLLLTSAINSIPSLVRSPLNYHVSILELYRHDTSDAHVSRSTLHQLRVLPQLTHLKIAICSPGAAAVLLQGTTAATMAEKLRAALPPSLRAFSITTGPLLWRIPTAKFDTLAAGFLAAAAAIPQLTEPSIHHESSWDGMQLDALVALPLLRKLTIIGSTEGTPLYKLKQLSQLRELVLGRVRSADFLLMCQPPHSLQLESLRMDVAVGEMEMRALLHLPTLTELDPSSLAPAGWPLLPQLPRLRRLTIAPRMPFTGAMASSLSASLAACTALDDLTIDVDFSQEDRSELSEDNQQSCWSTLLRSVPNLRRLVVDTVFLAPLLTVLPAHLPRLEQLALRCWQSTTDVTQLAHPTLQHVELLDFRPLTDAEVQSLFPNPRLPRLISCKISPY